MADYFLEGDMQLLAERQGFGDFSSARQQLIALQSQLDEEYELPAEFMEAIAIRIVFDIFLSYSSKDSVAVLGLYYWLTARGRYRVYLDCFDAALPNPAVVTRKTASVLRKRMVQSRSLFVATTQNTPASTWVPWELGFTDGLTNKAAVLYLAPRSGVTFYRQSYFELYPEVLQDNNQSKPKDLIITDALARPQLNCDWMHWLSLPKRY